MTPASITAAALLFKEARLLDTGAWAEWADLYEPDAIYWVPAWIDEARQTNDPATQVSIIYHDTRKALLERIARIESRKSITALPLPRTSHLIGNVEATQQDGAINCLSSFTVHVVDPRTAREYTRHGRYAHALVERDGAWRIARKVITLINDKVPTVLDFYSI